MYLEILVELLPKVVVDRGDDEVDLEELGGQADHQEEGEEGDQEHLISKDEMRSGKDVNQSEQVLRIVSFVCLPKSRRRWNICFKECSPPAA